MTHLKNCDVGDTVSFEDRDGSFVLADYTRPHRYGDGIWVLTTHNGIYVGIVEDSSGVGTDPVEVARE